MHSAADVLPAAPCGAPVSRWPSRFDAALRPGRLRHGAWSTGIGPISYMGGRGGGIWNGNAV